jgi:hypothetical protein
MTPRTKTTARPRGEGFDDSLLRHSSQVAAATMQAMATILTSAGFTVEDANDEHRSHRLRW